MGRRKLCHFFIFSKNLPHVIASALNTMKLLRLLSAWGFFEFAMVLVSRLTFCTNICANMIIIESSPIRQIVVYFSSLILHTLFLAQKHQF